MTTQHRAQRFFRIFVFALITSVVVGYGYFRFKDYSQGPILTVHSPENGASTSSPLINISGSAKNIAFITMNDRKIFTDENGVWSEKLLLHTGYNIIKVNVRDRFEREETRLLEIVRTGDNAVLVQNERKETDLITTASTTTAEI